MKVKRWLALILAMALFTGNTAFANVDEDGVVATENLSADEELQKEIDNGENNSESVFDEEKSVSDEELIENAEDESESEQASDEDIFVPDEHLNGDALMTTDEPERAAALSLPDSLFTDIALLKKELVADEHFDEIVNFGKLNAYKDGTWERYRYVSEDEGRTVTPDIGKILLDPVDLMVKSGVRYNLPPLKGTIVVEVEATRVGEASQPHRFANELRFNVKYDKENRYYYTSEHIDKTAGVKLTLEGDLNVPTKMFYVMQTGSPVLKAIRPDGVLDQKRNASVDTATDEEAWDCIEFFTMGAPYEINSVKVYTYTSGPVYLNESFDDMTVSADDYSALTDKGYSLGEYGVAGDLAITEGGLKLGSSNNSSANTDMTIPIPNDLSSEFYLTARIKGFAGINGNNFLMQVYFDGLNGTVGTSRFVMGNQKLDYKIAYAGGRTIVNTTWTDVVLHVKGVNADLYLRKSDESEFTKVISQATSIDCTSHKKNNHFYIQGPVILDELRIFEKGVHYVGTDIKKDGGEVVATSEFIGTFLDETIDMDRPLAGILALYDSADMTKAATAQSSTIADIMENNGQLVTALTHIPTGAEKARFYLWDGIDEDGLQPQDEQLEPIEKALQ